MKREFRLLALGAIGLLGLGWLLSRATLSRRQQGQCQTNLKQIGLAMMQYSRDYDEKLPPAYKWQTVFVPYLSGHQDPPQPPLACPTGWQYAMNGNLARKSLGFMSNTASLPFAWDAATKQRNAMDNGRLWPSPSHHPNGNNVLFMDGHVAFRQQKLDFNVVMLPTPTPTLSSTPLTTVPPRKIKR